MSVDPYIGEIIMFAGNFAPRDWALCDGQLLAIAQFTALFSILGTTYGGDGQTTFALPDLRGRVPMHAGNGPGLSNRALGSRAGVENVTLNANQIAQHAHTATTTALLNTSSTEGDSSIPTGKVPAKSGIGDPDFADPDNADAQLDSTAIDATTTVNNAGGSQPHTNIQPFLVINFIIALQGTYPSPN
jgi:microcystin-dependent protein